MCLFFVYNDLGMKDYEEFYRKISEPLRRYGDAAKYCDLIISLTAFCSYPALLLFLYVSHSDDLPKMIVIPALSLAVISALRHIIGRRRPYEQYDIVPLIPKDQSGHSFPSRHVFSMAVISMCFLKVFPPYGALLGILTAAEIWLRTAGGVHYPSDVIAGAAAGIFAGLLLYL